jgi:hypothetical protein
MPRGGELSSFKVPGVGNLLHSRKKNTNPGGIAGGGGMGTAGIEPCRMVERPNGTSAERQILKFIVSRSPEMAFSDSLYLFC